MCASRHAPTARLSILAPVHQVSNQDVLKPIDQLDLQKWM